jgi:hypothetical protein
MWVFANKENAYLGQPQPFAARNVSSVETDALKLCQSSSLFVQDHLQC